MNKSSKGFVISTHIMIILVVGIAMTFILMLVLNLFFVADPPACNNIKYVIKDSCVSGTGSIKMDIVNNGNDTLMLNIGQEKYNPLTSSGVQPKKSKQYTVYTTGTTITVIPVVLAPSLSECRGKVQSIDINLIGKC